MQIDPTRSQSSALTILIIHQSAELYGSDRSLLELLSSIDRVRFVPIVCIPAHGALEDRLRQLAIEVHVTPLLKISRKSLSAPWRALALPITVARVLSKITAAVKGRGIDVVYSNTLAVFAGALWAKQRGIPHVWHIREILHRPKIVSSFFQRFVPAFSSLILCNSDQTRNWIAARSATRAVTVWNGVQILDACSSLECLRLQARERLGLQGDVPVVLMIGRINARKGQDLLLDAIETLHGDVTTFRVVFVGGGVPGETQPVEAFLQQVAASPWREQISVRPFTNNVADYYLAGDILVLPSRHPESFGRVAIEAMACGLPVVAAGHGGVLEIVEDGETGLLFQPGDAADLAAKLGQLLKDADLRMRMGAASRSRQMELFSLDAYTRAVEAQLLSMAERTSELKSGSTPQQTIPK